MNHVLLLTECFRQKNDLRFFKALKEVRKGRVSNESVQYFMTRHYTDDHDLDSNSTRLFFLRENVHKYNNAKMNELKGKQLCNLSSPFRLSEAILS